MLVLTGVHSTVPVPLIPYVIVKYELTTLLAPTVIVTVPELAVIVGASLSTLTVVLVVEELPAKSVVVKVTKVPTVLAVILVISNIELECPLKASVPSFLVILTFVVYQLLEPIVPAKLIVPTVGLVLSSL